MIARRTNLLLWIVPLAFTALLATTPPPWLVVYPVVTVALFLLGQAFYRITGSLWPALLAQAAPFLSQIILPQDPFPSRPEPLAIAATAFLLAAILAAARAERPTDRHGLMVGVALGSGILLTPQFAVLGVVSVLLLDRRRLLLAFATALLVAALGFIAPEPASAELFSPMSGVALRPYPQAVFRLLAAKIIFSATIGAVLVVLIGYFRMRRRGLLAANPLARLAVGMILAQIAIILVAAKQSPASDLVPALLLTGPSLAVAWHLTAQATDPLWHKRAWRGVAAALIVLTVPMVWIRVAELAR